MSFFRWLFGPSHVPAATPTVKAPVAIEDVPPFIMIEGRPILLDSPYILPKDAQESNRLDLQHFLLRTVFHGNYSVPLAEPAYILDVGCGSGRWGIEMAQEFSQASVIGCDILEQDAGVRISHPLNYRFMQADVLKGLHFPDQSFDFVHQRLLFLALPESAWPNVVRELVRVTRPGGWVELLESQICSENMGPATTRTAEWAMQLTRQRGIEAAQVRNLAEDLRLAGLTNITTRRIAIPIGHWGGRVGQMMQTDAYAAVTAMKPLITSRLNINPEEFDHVMSMVADEAMRMHMALPFTLTYGQRPL